MLRRERGRKRREGGREQREREFREERRGGRRGEGEGADREAEFSRESEEGRAGLSAAKRERERRTNAQRRASKRVQLEGGRERRARGGAPPADPQPCCAASMKDPTPAQPGSTTTDAVNRVSSSNNRRHAVTLDTESNARLQLPEFAAAREFRATP
eukprot:1513778-Rhodomonas_salina.1